jgi:uncharacterized iron-regulated membrane protein
MNSMSLLSSANPSSRIMSLEFTQPLTEVSTGIFLESRARPAHPPDPANCVSRLSRKCVILDVLQPYGLPLPATGLALLFIGLKDTIELFMRYITSPVGLYKVDLAVTVWIRIKMNG